MTPRTRIDQPIWSPDPAHVRATRMHQFSQFVCDRNGLSLDTYEALWQWSIENREAFWSAVWSFCGVRGSPGQTVLVDGDSWRPLRWVKGFLRRLPTGETMNLPISPQLEEFFRVIGQPD